MRRLGWLALVLLLPGAAAAQLPPAQLGAGVAWMRGDSVSGHGFHAQVGTTVFALADAFELRVEGLYQRARLGGYPFTCDRVAPGNCLLRTDHRRIAGLGSSLLMRLESRGRRVRAYLVPLGFGLYHQHLKNIEIQGPVASVCFGDGTVTPCHDDTPRVTYTTTDSDLGVGLGTGVGFDARVLGVRLFLDMRVYQFWGLGEDVKAAPFVFGVSLGGPGDHPPGR